jgi:hypothetical protein
VGEGDSVENVSESEESEDEASESLRRLVFLRWPSASRRLPEFGILIGEAVSLGVRSAFKSSSSAKFLLLSKDTLEDITSE